MRTTRIYTDRSVLAITESIKAPEAWNDGVTPSTPLVHPRADRIIANARLRVQKPEASPDVLLLLAR